MLLTQQLARARFVFVFYSSSQSVGALLKAAGSGRMLDAGLNSYMQLSVTDRSFAHKEQGVMADSRSAVR